MVNLIFQNPNNLGLQFPKESLLLHDSFPNILRAHVTSMWICDRHVLGLPCWEFNSRACVGPVPNLDHSIWREGALSLLFHTHYFVKLIGPDDHASVFPMGQRAVPWGHFRLGKHCGEKLKPLIHVVQI